MAKHVPAEIQGVGQFREQSALYQFLTKEAEELSSNEDETHTEIADSYDEPEEQKKREGTSDAPWGKPGMSASSKQGDQDAFHNNDGTYDAHLETRGELLARRFNSLKPASVADKKLMQENFENFTPGETISHSPLLQKESAYHFEPTLKDRIRALKDFGL